METLIARKVIGNEELHFVLVNDAGTDDKPVTLLVNAHHYSSRRACRAKGHFSSIEKAITYCEEEYEVPKESWQSELRFSGDFHFHYRIAAVGDPRPHPLGFEGRQIVFHLGEQEDADSNTTPTLSIVGNREGLRWLAATLLLLADGERYDERLHTRLENDDEGIFTDIPVLIHSPSYFGSLLKQTGPEGAFDFAGDAEEEEGAL